ncbi:hypothetical protein [Hymenobacter armeniacus]|uniref:Secreted protein n=1 Tax=Hymenobacter armeniacus TaxID=2771358 RepID=A0ABR8JNJ4_9BACT|nr:hypothetical protein [Hymenobacter armeniacus]MBD2721564.1 hypothetical protein [Hymenobacter armeniacus]
MSGHLLSWRLGRFFLCGAFCGALGLLHTLAAGAKPEPRVFRPGHYRLADGVSHAGSLCLVSDNELLVKADGAVEPQRFGAVQVQNFVIGADSFAVLRKFDVVVNGVLTQYPCAMVRVHQAAGGLELYGLQGTMDVYKAAPSSQAMMLSSVGTGMSYGVAGVAGGALLQKKTGTYEEKVMTVLLLRTPAHPELQTLQPQSKEAHDLLQALTADQPELSKKIRRLFPSAFTPEKMVELLAQYTAAKTGK